MKHLPESEFEIMRVLWSQEPPVSTGVVMESLGETKKWKRQTVITLLLRLTERGFVRGEKQGKENIYYPLVEKKDYLEFETRDFIKRFHGNSLASLVSSFSASQRITQDDIEELERLIERRKQNDKSCL